MRQDSSLIPYGRQWIDDDDIQAVEEVLRSPSITRGKRMEEFEQKLCRLTGVQYAVVVNSGTSALHLACLAAGASLAGLDSRWTNRSHDGMESRVLGGLSLDG